MCRWQATVRFFAFESSKENTYAYYKLLFKSLKHEFTTKHRNSSWWNHCGARYGVKERNLKLIFLYSLESRCDIVVGVLAQQVIFFNDLNDVHVSRDAHSQPRIGRPIPARISTEVMPAFKLNKTGCTWKLCQRWSFDVVSNHHWMKEWNHGVVFMID